MTGISGNSGIKCRMASLYKLVCVLFSVSFLFGMSACGDKEEETAGRFFGVDVMQTVDTIVRPTQIIDGTNGVWIVSSEKYGCIYSFTKSTGAAEQIGWERGESEYLVHAAESGGELYAMIHNREEDTIQIRKRSKDGIWSMTAELDAKGEAWSGRESLFFADNKRNFYLTGEKMVECFSPGGEQLCRYKLSGSPCSVTTDENDSILCLSLKAQGIVLSELNGKEAVEKWTYPGTYHHVFLIENTDSSVLCAAADETILFFNRDTGELLEKSDLAQTGIQLSAQLSGSFQEKEGTLQLYGSGEEDYLACVRMKEQTGEEVKQRVNLTYGTVSGTFEYNSAIKERIASFNRTNQDYYITIKVYEGDAGMVQMTADIIGGKGPDIIDLFDNSLIGSGVSYIDLVNKGCLLDLTDFLERPEYKEDVFWNILEADRINGTLGRIAPHFFVTGIAIAPEYESQIEEWNLDTYLDIIAKNDGKKHISNMAFDPEQYLSSSMYCMQSEFIDWEQKKADFDSEKFTGLLEICKKYGKRPDSYQDATYADEAASQVLFYETIFIDVLSYLQGASYFGREYPVYGYPAEDGHFYHYSAREDACGINSQSNNKEGAWAFIETLLDPEYQFKNWRKMCGMPIRIACWDNMCEQEKKLGTIVNSVQEEYFITDEEIALIKDILEHGEFGKGMLNEEIINVVMEEASFYFAGNKTAEEAAHIIQSRVEIILNE